MSHSTLTVVLPAHLEPHEIKEALAKALAPFDENKEVPEYVKETREQLVAKGREAIARNKERYDEFVADPENYASQVSNLRHLEWIAGGTEKARELVPNRYQELMGMFLASAVREYANLGYPMETHEVITYENSFPAQLEWTDEQVYWDQVKWYDSSELGPNGEVLSTYNPLSKWDWYSIGGRWANYWHILSDVATVEDVPLVVGGLTEASWALTDPAFADREYVQEWNSRPQPRADIARKCVIDFQEDGLFPATFALLDADGVWHEKGEMGWFGMVADEKAQEKWNAEYAVHLELVDPMAWLVLVDVHI